MECNECCEINCEMICDECVDYTECMNCTYNDSYDCQYCYKCVETEQYKEKEK